MRAQRIIAADIYAANPILTFQDIDAILPSIPNITNTTFPVTTYRAYYYNRAGLLGKANKLLKESSKINPYLFFSEHLLSQFYFLDNQIDSAYKYSKLAFYGWPKTFKHYELYNKILVNKKDKKELINAYNSISDKFINRKEYYKDFIKSLANYKMNDFKVYDSLVSINESDLTGKWQDVLEYNTFNSDTIKGSVINFLDQNQLIINQVTYNFRFAQDTLSLLPFNRVNYTLSKSKILYSPEYNTYILYSSQDNGYVRGKLFKKLL